MMVTVHPCFHWIGYHISTDLLQKGIEVVGIDPISDDRSDLLYMYVGRNSNFQHFHQKEDKESHVQQPVDETTIEYVSDCLLIKRLGEAEPIKEWVELPNLYGEWMDMERVGVDSKQGLLQWIQDNEAMYIGDFLEGLIPCVLYRQDYQMAPGNHDEEALEQRVEDVWCCQLLLEKM